MESKLSRREREIMDVLYALGDTATAEEIREKLSDPPSYSAVRAMLAKLEAKGVIKHAVDGLRYIYSPVTSRTAAQKKAVSNLMRVFFDGSPSQAAAALLKQEQWSDDELDALRKQIDAVRKNRRKP
ncbi:MAG TPA: BlaI/MecI/CopY family transcriptional regulator [Vicinamibacterales bacterium]|nr:BlaI/MecI/CopY family transcriptional regulator [Vicinamibacterales bacterium]